MAGKATGTRGPPGPNDYWGRIIVEIAQPQVGSWLRRVRCVDTTTSGALKRLKQKYCTTSRPLERTSIGHPHGELKYQLPVIRLPYTGNPTNLKWRPLLFRGYSIQLRVLLHLHRL